ncbi:FAD synthetase family protein [Ruixingdingia sedimenti]|uniref:FAD synthase n=1 Tax=Ruixingdingia sedimenti TaxID=3073604 RepID=A0ABU1F6D7_9RHOB|nr:FAD synthetase family protein [Xinfangfangia sp. LG-4]MDR5652440.1 FAD synthetase family protein [Xinfangfangia sp. LG-4]
MAATIHSAPVPGLGASVVTIGAFDGVHMGHQALIRSVIASGRAQGLPVVAWTFDPPPKVFFGRAPLLMCAQEKVARIASLGVDHVILSHFDGAFRARSAESFMDDLAAMNPAEVWVGDDFRFGAMQRGDVDLLRSRFAVRLLTPVMCRKGQRISSSRIRSHWERGEFHRVRELVGWEDFYVHPAWETGW